MDRLARKDKYGFSAVCENCPKHGMCNDSSDCEDVLAEKLIAYEDTGLEPEEITPRLRELAEADKDGRVVVLPCKVGDTAWVVDRCENVLMSRDDDYETGTGAMECPFESSCDTEDCEDDHVRVFETIVKDFWYGDDYANHLAIFLEHMGRGYLIDDVGKTVFLTRPEAEAAMKGGGD